MRSVFCLMICWLVLDSQAFELNLPVKDATREKLSLSLGRLVEELEFFRTPFENRINLYKRVTQIQFYLQQMTNEVCQYENMIRGKSNMIKGKNNIIIGSYNNIKGSNNYVFIQKYKGQANGDLLIGRWRIEIQKKRLILINSSMAISLINEQVNRRYFKLLTEDRVKGENGAKEQTVTVVRDDDIIDEMDKGIVGKGNHNATSGQGVIIDSLRNPIKVLSIRETVVNRSQKILTQNQAPFISSNKQVQPNLNAKLGSKNLRQHLYIPQNLNTFQTKDNSRTQSQFAGSNLQLQGGGGLKIPQQQPDLRSSIRSKFVKNSTQVPLSQPYVMLNNNSPIRANQQRQYKFIEPSGNLASWRKNF